MPSYAERLRDFLFSSAALGVSPLAKAKIFWRQTKNARVSLKLGAYNPDDVYGLDTTFGRLYFRDNFGDVTNLVKLIWQGEYRHRELSGPGVILDIGANIGMAAVWFSHFNPERAVHCFEPLPGNVEMVRLNCPSACVHPVAVGKIRGHVSLQVDAHNVMASSVACRWDTHEVQFDVIRLDDFTASEHIEHVALLKMDAEGMELDILEGARDTLAVTRHIVMETHGRRRHEGVIEFLRHEGFCIDSDAFSGGTGLLFASRAAAVPQNGAQSAYAVS